MAGRIQVYMVFFLLIGCSSQDQHGSTNNSNQSSVEVPEHLQDIENLTVYPADSEPAYTAEFIREVSFGDTDEVLVSLAPHSPLAVGPSDRVYIGDLQRTVHVYNPDGSYQTSVGRDGRGPGEFESINNILFHDDQLYVYDVGLVRFNTFSLETFEPVNTILFFPDNSGRIENPGGATPVDPIAIREDGTFLITYRQYRSRFFEPEDPDVDAYHRFYTVSADGRTIQDKVFQQSYSILFPIRPDVPIWDSRPVPFDWMPLYAISNEQYFFSAEMEDFLIKVYDSTGNYLYAFYHPFDRRQLSREESAEVPDNVTPPEAWPALNSKMTDDENRLWISTIVDSDEVYEWWVLQDSGELISRFEWPRDQPIELVKNGFLYTRETGEEGMVSFVRYRIELLPE